MLLDLRVKDLGIIEDIEWTLDQGLNVITGETGAGKSLIIDAVELLLTGVTDEDAIRYGANQARIEGVFDLSNDSKYSILKTYLDETGYSQDENTLILKCEIRKGKPGIVKVNGQTSTKTIFRQIGHLLIDIHGQSDHSSLLNKNNHLEILDAFAGTLEIKTSFKQKVNQLKTLETEFRSLNQKEMDLLRQEEFLRYQIEEIKKANLKLGEDEELERERQVIAFSERLKEYALQSFQSLKSYDSDQYTNSALTKLNEALKNIKKLVELDPFLRQQLDYLERTVYGIEEVARDVQAYYENLQADPARLEEIESRLELLRNLKRKYGKNILDILAFQTKAEIELKGIQNFEERKLTLKQRIDELKKELGLLALTLSKSRLKAAEKLSHNMKKELEDLEMSQMLFEVSFSKTSSLEGIGGEEGYYEFNSDGIDQVEFRASTNQGEPFKPLVKIASTGEISRFTLALKGALSEADNIPILIFDEIDIGIGGRSGDIIGKKLWSLSRNHQIICITHLPQIAVYADEHFFVHKSIEKDRTASILEKLSPELRTKEIAAMLGGQKYSAITLQNAKEMEEKAIQWKKKAK